jgi:tRNA threonylcarbamoyladenosine biosynthesis protein TsaE
MTLKTFITNSQEETEALGESLVGVIISSRLDNVMVLLEGELGAGKTTLTRGIAKGIGSSEGAQSPSFVFLEIHSSGLIPLYHFDLYRINDSSELDELGFFEFITRKGIVVIEWGERIEELTLFDIKIVLKKISPSSRAISVEFYNGKLEEMYERTFV